MSLSGQSDTDGKPLFGLGLHGIVTGYNFDELNTRLVENDVSPLIHDKHVQADLSLSIGKSPLSKGLFNRIDISAGQFLGENKNTLFSTLKVWQTSVLLAYSAFNSDNYSFYGGSGLGFTSYRLTITEPGRSLESFNTAIGDLSGSRTLIANSGLFIAPTLGFDFSLNKYPDMVFSFSAAYRISTTDATWASFGRTVEDAPSVKSNGLQCSFGMILY